jgi:cytochrome P450
MKPEIDPFREARKESGIMKCPYQGEDVPLVLRHADVRSVAKDWKTFSSDAPFRVPVPSEEEVRTVRQLPIETDPPDHMVYRKIVEPYFMRAKLPGVIADMDKLIDGMLLDAIGRDSIEIVENFSLPLQSRAFTFLLNVPMAEADKWIGWGIHVFRVGEGTAKGASLENYIQGQLDRAKANPGDDFFSALTRATFKDRPLTRDEMQGFANLAFAGGRDTIIHTVSSIIAYFAKNPAALEFLREDTSRITHASEEFFRVFMPLTHIGRVCPQETEINGVTVPANGRISLCWASANMDEEVFDAPEEIRLERKPNPHLSFGFGTHLCLGAPHARLVVRTLLQKLCQRVKSIAILDAHEHVEKAAAYERISAFESLTVKFAAL